MRKATKPIVLVDKSDKVKTIYTTDIDWVCDETGKMLH